MATALLLQGGEVGWLWLVGLATLTGVRVRQQQRLEEHVAEPLEMVAIPGGTFLMGSAEDDAQAYSEEHPQHRVTVSDFLMARYPVTRKQYREVTGQRPVGGDGTGATDAALAYRVSTALVPIALGGAAFSGELCELV